MTDTPEPVSASRRPRPDRLPRPTDITTRATAKARSRRTDTWSEAFQGFRPDRRLASPALEQAFADQTMHLAMAESASMFVASEHQDRDARLIETILARSIAFTICVGSAGLVVLLVGIGLWMRHPQHPELGRSLAGSGGGAVILGYSLFFASLRAKLKIGMRHLLVRSNNT